MAQPNYLGTRSGLTGIPSLLLSSLQEVEDDKARTALYQVQNWANSFFTWNFASFSGAYTTGGVTLTFGNPFPSNIDAVVATPYTTGSAAIAAIAAATLTTVTVQLFAAGGTEIANGTSVEFSYIAVGH